MNHSLEPMRPAPTAITKEPPIPKNPIKSFAGTTLGIKMNERGIAARTMLQNPNQLPVL
jgi:hypothetical protein